MPKSRSSKRPQGWVAPLRFKGSDGIVRNVTTYPLATNKNGVMVHLRGFLIGEHWGGYKLFARPENV